MTNFCDTLLILNSGAQRKTTQYFEPQQMSVDRDFESFKATSSR